MMKKDKEIILARGKLEYGNAEDKHYIEDVEIYIDNYKVFKEFKELEGKTITLIARVEDE